MKLLPWMSNSARGSSSKSKTPKKDELQNINLKLMEENKSQDNSSMDINNVLQNVEEFDENVHQEFRDRANINDCLTPQVRLNGNNKAHSNMWGPTRSKLQINGRKFGEQNRMNSQILSPLEEEESPDNLKQMKSALLPGDASSKGGGRLKKSFARSGAMSDADWTQYGL